MPRTMKATKNKMRSRKGGTKRAVRRAVRATRRTAKRAMSTPAARKRSAPVTGRTDAIALLKQDHREVLPMLDDLKRVSGGRRQQLLARVEHALQTHTKIEEEIFYPAFRDLAVTAADRRMFHEAREEHHAVDTVLREVSSASGEPDVFPARVKVLKEIVEHHAEEEEKCMFPRFRTLCPANERQRLGAEMRARKRSLAERTGAFAAVTSLFSR